MKKVTIKITLDGEGAEPDLLNIRKLAKFIGPIEDAIYETASAAGIELPKSSFFNLRKVEDKCAECEMRMRKEAIGSLEELKTSIRTGDTGNLPSAAARHLSKLSRDVKALDWTLDIEGGDSEPATLDKELSHRLRPPKIKGFTTLQGHVNSVSYSKRYIQFQIVGSKSIRVGVSQDHLTKFRRINLEAKPPPLFRLEGLATWHPETFQVEYMNLKRFQVLERPDPRKLFTELGDAIGPSMADRDVSSWLNELRGRDDDDDF